MGKICLLYQWKSAKGDLDEIAEREVDSFASQLHRQLLRLTIVQREERERESRKPKAGEEFVCVQVNGWGMEQTNTITTRRKATMDGGKQPNNHSIHTQ